MAQLPASQYDSIADGYDSTDHPAAKLQHEMVSKAIGDCTRLSVLDLGGGTGIYARRAISQGAELVDVVDNSAEMLEKGRIIEATRTNSGIKGKIRWFEGDVSETLHNLPLLPEGYDMVMCNWVFNHANTNEVRLASALDLRLQACDNLVSL
jgi:ubiquinone/menaquinone biosynthesis C-methylase UbiE